MTRRPAMDEHRRLEQLTRTKALDLLSSVNLGRLVFTHQALPAIRPVNHLVECESIIVRATAGGAIPSAGQRPPAVGGLSGGSGEPDDNRGAGRCGGGEAR